MRGGVGPNTYDWSTGETTASINQVPPGSYSVTVTDALSNQATANITLAVISPDGREGSATIHQDADIYRVRLPKGQSITHEVKTSRGVWFQLIKGGITAHGSTLNPGDAFATEDTGMLTLTASDDAEALLFDLA